MSSPTGERVGPGGWPEGSVPSRHVDPRARPGYRDQPGDGLPLPPLPSLGEIEKRIMRCDDELEKLVEVLYAVGEQAADAKADWERHLAICLLEIADAPGDDDRMKGYAKSADLREAYARRKRVDPLNPSNPECGDDLYRLYKILAARENGVQTQVTAVRARMMGLMSVAKGIRGVAN